MCAMQIPNEADGRDHTEEEHYDNTCSTAWMVTTWRPNPNRLVIRTEEGEARVCHEPAEHTCREQVEERSECDRPWPKDKIVEDGLHPHPGPPKDMVQTKAKKVRKGERDEHQPEASQPDHDKPEEMTQQQGIGLCTPHVGRFKAGAFGATQGTSKVPALEAEQCLKVDDMTNTTTHIANDEHLTKVLEEVMNAKCTIRLKMKRSQEQRVQAPRL